MKKLHTKQKNWLLAKSEKAIRKLQKKKDNKKQKKSSTYNSKKKTVKIVKAPRIFSIMTDPNSTLNFFNEVYKVIKQLHFGEELFFDLSKIENVTVDAIMYLIALLKNTKRLNLMHINCSGNVPLYEEARKVIETSGFYKYVFSRYSVKYRVSLNIKISSSKVADPTLAGKICDFVHNNSSLGRLETKPLFTMIMELMTNTQQHAYRYTNSIKSNWYIFVESGHKQIQFVFLDTGEGIPNTIRKKFWEKIKSGIYKSDSQFISSALRGEFRTETRLEHRGKGLPEIYNKASDKIISDFSIVSGNGQCDVDDTGNIIETKLLSELKGTLFCWKLNKHKKENDI